MKKIFTFFILSFFHLCSSGQPGTWTWISGSKATNSTGVFGTQGMPSVNNHPPGIYEASEWKDKQGNFWIYGGWNSTVYCDLWKYNPLTLEWTWVKGPGGTSQRPIYGTKGIANAANSPGSSSSSASWVDTGGNLWYFEGDNAVVGMLNVLWKYDISANSWTWMTGDTVLNGKGVYGIQGTPNASNTPGARYETCSAWTDSLNNLWLFGGVGRDSLGNGGILSDLWKYNIAANEWTWMKGSPLANVAGNYGVKGVANATNDPGKRWTYTKWKDVNDNLWIMGGYNSVSYFNDVWKYDLSLNEWTWMYGPNTVNDAGNYQNTCVFDTINMPSSRVEQRSSVTDNCGKFWLFGGATDLFNTMLNDLWVFDPKQLKWEWLSGTNNPNQGGNYGTLGMSSPSNTPPSRQGALAWWGNDNKFYMFGGYGVNGVTYSDLWVFNPDTNCVSVSCPVAVIVPPVAGFQASQTTICANDCINFTDLSTNATSWQWHFYGAIDSTSTDQNPQGVCYLTTGIYNVTLIASNPGGSDSLTINNYISVNTAPPTPVITQVNDTMLYCSLDTSYRSFQWFLDSALIPGATDTFLVIHQGGNYNVQVSNAAGCKIAVGINIILGLQNYMSNHFVLLWPNPVQDKFTIHNSQFTTGTIDIYNVIGQVCQSEINNPKSEIDVSGLPSGVYFVQVIGVKETWVGRFVKQ